MVNNTYGHRPSRSRSYPALNRKQQRQVADHFFVAERLASKWHYGSKDTGDLEYDDLVQAACWGMCKAILRYRPEQGDLKGYLWVCANGAIWHEIRDRSRTVRPPQAYLNFRGEAHRLHRLQGKSLQQTVEKLKAKYPKKAGLFTEAFVTDALASYKSETASIDDQYGLHHQDDWLTELSREYGVSVAELEALLQEADSIDAPTRRARQ